MVLHLIYQGCLRVASFLIFFFFSAQLRWFTLFCLPICWFVSLYQLIYCWFLLVSFLFQLLYYLTLFPSSLYFITLLKFSCVHPFFSWFIIFMIIILKYSSGSLLISKQSLLIYLFFEISFWSFIWNIFLCILLFPDSLLLPRIR